MKAFTLAVRAAVSALALAAAGVAYAAVDQARHAGADRVVTRAEAQERAEQLFARLDANHDGKLDKADREARLNEMFDRLDTDHDGKISREEFLAAHERGRGMMGPGMMGEGMMHDGPPPGAPEGGAMGDHGRHHPGGPGMGGHGRMHGRMGEGMMLMAIIHTADPQHTGTITKQAFVGAALKLFDMADTNHDGKLTPQERQAARLKMRERFRARMMEHHGEHHDGAMGDMPPPPPTP